MLSVLSCLLVMGSGLLGPVFDSSTRNYALAFEASALGTSLAVGVWKPAQTNAPVLSSRKDAFLAAILSLLLILCVAAFVTSGHR